MVQKLKSKPVAPVWSLYREECGQWKVSVVWCLAIGLLQVFGREGSVVVSAAGQRCSVIEGILTDVIARHTGTLAW